MEYGRLESIPGFFVSGPPYTPGLAKAWVKACGYDRVPEKAPLETQLGIRLNETLRDLEWFGPAIAEGTELGFKINLNIGNRAMARFSGVDAQAIASLMLDYPDLRMSYGNLHAPGSALRMLGDFAQSDGGVAAASYDARFLPPGTRYGIHGYFETGFAFRHLESLTKAFPGIRFSMLELARGFRRHGENRKARKYLYTEETGLAEGIFLRRANAIGVDCVLFQGRDYFDETGKPNARFLTIIDGPSRADIKPYRSPLHSGIALSGQMLWNRFRRPFHDALALGPDGELPVESLEA